MRRFFHVGGIHTLCKMYSKCWAKFLVVKIACSYIYFYNSAPKKRLSKWGCVVAEPRCDLGPSCFEVLGRNPDVIWGVVTTALMGDDVFGFGCHMRMSMAHDLLGVKWDLLKGAVIAGGARRIRGV